MVLTEAELGGDEAVYPRGPRRIDNPRVNGEAWVRDLVDDGILAVQGQGHGVEGVEVGFLHGDFAREYVRRAWTDEHGDVELAGSKKGFQRWYTDATSCLLKGQLGNDITCDGCSTYTYKGDVLDHGSHGAEVRTARRNTVVRVLWSDNSISGRLRYCC